MSVYSRIKETPLVEPVLKNQTPFFKSNTNPGFERLVFVDDQTNEIELHDEGGYNITFYPNGALLTLKDTCRYHEGSKSYIFFNNNGKQVVDVYNSTRERKPEKDIEVKIYQGHIWVEEKDFNNGSKQEYFISIKNGEKIINVGTELDKNNQYTISF